MAPKKQPNAPRTNDEALTPVATYSARGNQTIVRKSNDLIQNAMYSLTLSQQKLMLHIFAMIKPSDTELPRYEMSIYEFLKLCGVDPHNGSMYKQVKKNIEDIANAKAKVWTLEGNVLQAHRVSTGMNDGVNTEILSGVKAGLKVITGITVTEPEEDKESDDQEQSPFAPGPKRDNKKEKA